MEVAVIGFATAFNFIFILIKFKRGRIPDAVLDISIFVCIAFMFAGTISGMSVGMVASAVVSVYLWFNPPMFLEHMFMDTESENKSNYRDLL